MTDSLAFVTRENLLVRPGLVCRIRPQPPTLLRLDLDDQSSCANPDSCLSQASEFLTQEFVSRKRHNTQFPTNRPCVTQRSRAYRKSVPVEHHRNARTVSSAKRPASHKVRTRA